MSSRPSWETHCFLSGGCTSGPTTDLGRASPSVLLSIERLSCYSACSRCLGDVTLSDQAAARARCALGVHSDFCHYVFLTTSKLKQHLPLRRLSGDEWHLTLHKLLLTTHKLGKPNRVQQSSCLAVSQWTDAQPCLLRRFCVCICIELYRSIFVAATHYTVNAVM